MACRHPTQSQSRSRPASASRPLRIVLGPYRVLYAFDPRRAAILLLGGDKTGNNRWYDENIPVADDRYDDHLLELKKEGLI